LRTTASNRFPSDMVLGLLGSGNLETERGDAGGQRGEPGGEQDESAAGGAGPLAVGAAGLVRGGTDRGLLGGALLGERDHRRLVVERRGLAVEHEGDDDLGVGYDRGSSGKWGQGQGRAALPDWPTGNVKPPTGTTRGDWERGGRARDVRPGNQVQSRTGPSRSQLAAGGRRRGGLAFGILGWG